MNQGSTKTKNFNNCFCAILNYIYRSPISERKTGRRFKSFGNFGGNSLCLFMLAIKNHFSFCEQNLSQNVEKFQNIIYKIVDPLNLNVNMLKVIHFYNQLFSVFLNVYLSIHQFFIVGFTNLQLLLSEIYNVFFYYVFLVIHNSTYTNPHFFLMFVTYSHGNIL